MIDFVKELHKYNFATVDKELIAMRDETTLSMDSFGATLKKLRKEQGEVNFQIEEVITILDDMKEDNTAVAELKKKRRAEEEEKMAVIKTLISVLDQFEDYYRYVRKYAEKSWSEQLTILWSNVAGILLSRGIFRIEGENTIFNPQLHVAGNLSNNNCLPEGLITDVIKSGYMYNNNVLRKAEVVVNKLSNCG